MQRRHDILAEEQRRSRPNATSELMESTTRNKDNEPFILIVDEKNNKGRDNEPVDEYDKHNPEPNEDALLEATGATIKYSAVTIGNETYVRRPIKGIF